MGFIQKLFGLCEHDWNDFPRSRRPAVLIMSVKRCCSKCFRVEVKTFGIWGGNGKWRFDQTFTPERFSEVFIKDTRTNKGSDVVIVDGKVQP